MKTNIYDIPLTTLSGDRSTMSAYKGKTLLIVNTASKCGFTGQYEGLEALNREYAARGLVVLGFPCDQFGHQEPGDSATIGAFCSKNYGVTFPLFEKTEVNGANTHPLFEHLKSEARGIAGTQSIKWNFTKFLVDREGNVKSRHAPKDTPESLRSNIEELLGS